MYHEQNQRIYRTTVYRYRRAACLRVDAMREGAIIILAFIGVSMFWVVKTQKDVFTPAREHEARALVYAGEP